MRILFSFLAAAALWAADAASSPALGQALIIENAGQFPAEVRYAIQQGGDRLWITDESLWLSKRGKDGGLNLRIDFEEANPINIRPSGHSSTKVSYFIGNDESQWHADVPVYTGLKFQNLYDGVDLDIGAENGKLEWRWIVGRGKKVPGRSAIRVSGGDRISETVEGVEIGSEVGDFTLRHPAPYDVDGNRIGGKLNTRNAGAADLIWSTYVGFLATSEGAKNLVIDHSGAVYLCGKVPSIMGFPVAPGVAQVFPRGVDEGVVLKIQPNGTSLAYATYIGGTANDNPLAIAVADGIAYVVGTTYSIDFPVLDGAPRKTAQSTEGFLIALNETGTKLVTSTFIGGPLEDEVSRITITPDKKILLAGITYSGSVLGRPDDSGGHSSGFRQGFFALLEGRAPAVQEVKLFSLLSIAVKAVAATASGVIYVAGDHRSGSPLSHEVYILKFDRAVSAQPALCTMGGAGDDWVQALQLDDFGNPVIGGSTNSTSLRAGSKATQAAIRPEFNGFLMKVRASDCNSMIFATYLGTLNTFEESVSDIALDAGGNIYVAATMGSGFPTTPNAVAPNSFGGPDALLARFRSNGQEIQYATYFGGLDVEQGRSIAVLPDQTVVLAGYTRSPGLPGAAASWQPAIEGSEDLFVAKFKIDDPGAINGYAFQDYNQNGTAGPYELPLAGLIIYDDLNNNGVLDSITERSAGSAYLYGYLPGTNIPYMFVPNYGLNNLLIGVHRICASFAPTVANSSTCKNVTIQFGSTRQNVNFGLLPGQVGVSSLTPKTSTVKVGDKLVLELNWAHPENWRKLNEAILRLTGSGSTDSLQIRYLEAPNTFSFYNDDAGKFGPAFEPGAQNVLETNEAKFYLEETAVQGSGPTGKSVKLRLVISFKPKAAGKTLDALFFVSDDNGDIQGYEPLGKITVIS